jgi:hypothetical protein
MSKTIKTRVEPLADDIFQIVMYSSGIAGMESTGCSGLKEIDTKTVAYQGTLAECEIYLRLREEGYIDY